MKSLCLYTVAILCLIGCSAAYGQTVSKEKKISGHFPAGKGKLIIDNRYGKLDIHTWDKNEVTVDITVTAKASSAGEAQEILDKVSISEPQNNSADIHYKTLIGKIRTFNKREFRIDYVVNMPRKHAADLSNRYGDIELADMAGQLDLDLEYGALKAGQLKGPDKEIKVNFGSIVLSSLETGNVRSSYSSMSIDNAGSITVSNQFGKTTIGTVRDLDIDQRYGSLKINSAQQLNGTVQFADLSVGRLLKSAELKLEYSSHVKFDYVAADQIRIKANFSNLSFHFDDNASLAADITMTFGKLDNDVDQVQLNTAKAGHTGASYKGKIGSGRGTMVLNVNYGNLSFR